MSVVWGPGMKWVQTQAGPWKAGGSSRMILLVGGILQVPENGMGGSISKPGLFRLVTGLAQLSARLASFCAE